MYTRYLFSFTAKLLLSLSLVCSSPVWASLADSTSIRGFGTLALTQAGNSELGFRNDIGQEGQFGGWELKTDSVLGVQADSQFSERLSFHAQLIAKDRLSNDADSYVERAHLSYNLNQHWALRLGRISNDTSLISEFGSVGYAYDWVRSPQEYYGSIPIYYFDGADVTYKAYFDSGTLSTRLFIGQASNLKLSVAENSDFDLSPYVATSLRFDTNNFTARAGYAQASVSDFENEQYSQLTSFLDSISSFVDTTSLQSKLVLDDKYFHYYTLGGEYRLNSWKFASELSYLDTETEVVIPFVSGYLSVSRRFDAWGIYSIASFIKPTRSPYSVDSAIANFSAQAYSSLYQTFNYTDSEQQTFSIGTRWDIYPGIALKAQWDRSWVEAGRAFLWDQHDHNDDNASQSVDTYTFLISFIF